MFSIPLINLFFAHLTEPVPFLVLAGLTLYFSRDNIPRFAELQTDQIYYIFFVYKSILKNQLPYKKKKDQVRLALSTMDKLTLA